MENTNPVYISPAEDALFVKALTLLWERRLAMEGCAADIQVIRITPDESKPTDAA